jgi:hypothetical protein
VTAAFLLKPRRLVKGSPVTKEPRAARPSTLHSSARLGRYRLQSDTYGGAINKIASDATAFVHRDNTKYSIQYYMEWANPTASDANIAMMRTLYTSMRPHVSGAANVNYCDLDLGDGYARAYWGDNLPRLMKIKADVDPKNIVSHAQSVPLS